MKRNLRESGQFIPLVGLSLVIIGLFSGLTVDGGRAYLQRARLAKLVDSASLAGARALIQGEAVALARACDAGRANGYECAQNGGPLVVSTVTVNAPDGTPQKAVKVSASLPLEMSFLKLGRLLGCSTCGQMAVGATATATPGLVDVVLVIDDTGSMSGAKATAARAGAKTVVNKLVASGSDLVKIAITPFRGCYGSSGSECIRNSGASNRQLALTNDKNALFAKIDLNLGDGGSGTNVCSGLEQGRRLLFGTGARNIARKIVIILTDTDNNYTTFSGATIPSPNNCLIVSQSNTDTRLNTLDTRTNTLSSDIKAGTNPGTSGQPAGKIVEVFVLRYDTAGSDSATNKTCTPSQVGSGSGREGADARDRNLARCLATRNGNDATGYFYFAASAAQIETGLQDIADEILRKLRLVS